MQQEQQMGENAMKATVDRDLCIGCGLCAAICPDVFEMDGEGKSVVIADPVPPASEAEAQDAAEQCPVGAITLTD
jgi:ferredoxin